MSDEWTQIQQALQNPKFKWRTVRGVAKETGLDPNIIHHELFKRDNEIIKSAIPSKAGHDLFSTRDHYRQKTTLWERFESSITNKVST